MMKKSRFWLVLGGLALAGGVLWAQTQPKPAPETASTSSDYGTAAKGDDKAGLQGQLKDRLNKIGAMYKERLDFMSREDERWQNFWTKMRDDRKAFESRITREQEALIDSLSSLDPNDRPSAVLDFEKMQANQIRSFEAQQKQKMANFFEQWLSRGRESAIQAEKERTDFVADGESIWETQKARLSK